jgi:hypothetical protein
VRILGEKEGGFEVASEKEGMVQGVAEERVDRIPPERDEALPWAPAPQADSLAASVGGLSLWVFPDAPGNDHENPNGEYAVITNGGEASVSLNGWMLCDAARHCFTFPLLAHIPAGQQIVLFTGPGESDGVSFFMNSGSAVWNNDGDTATLLDQKGRTAASYVY